MTQPAARLDGIVKRFGAVTALDGARLELRRGEIHGVLGENGAGKSTLFGVLGGMIAADEGTVTLDGREASIGSPRDAWDGGVGLVHQHFKLVPRLTVIENLALGQRSSGRRWTLRYDDLRGRVRKLSEETGLEVPLDAPVESIGVGDRQRVEILKALLREPDTIVLDEPTAVLAPPEVERLFELLRRLAADGKAVALVAHKLDEVLSVADRVTVMRDGRTVLEAERSEVDASTLARAMVGAAGEDAVTSARPTRTREPGEVVAACTGVDVTGELGEAALTGVELDVARGEIVGVAGVDGNGQKELALLLAGRLRGYTGQMTLPERIGFIPQDRTLEGLALDLDLAENVALLLHRSGGGWALDWPGISAEAEEIRRAFDVRAPDTRSTARSLSGGNQQRLVVGRELSAAADLLVAENPTRGLDVAATAFVHETLSSLVERENAPGVVLISTDLDEVLALSDRVMALVRGRLIEVSPRERTREGVGRIMLGGGA